MSQVKLVVDAMGGDDAPDVVLEGVEQALLEDPEIFVYLTGPAKIVVPFAEGHERCEAVPAEEVIGMGEHPANAVPPRRTSPTTPPTASSTRRAGIPASSSMAT